MSSNGQSRGFGRVFIGSSKEQLPVAESLQALLARHSDVELWAAPNAFRLSRNTLEELLRHARESDFAVLVLAGDDLVEKREERGLAPRDNAMFELGLFYGALGSERVYWVFCGDEPPVLPSDLAGVSAGIYPHSSPERMISALSPAALKIRDAMAAATAAANPAMDALNDLLEIDIEQLSKVLSIRSEDVGVHLWEVDTRGSQPVLRRTLRVRIGSAPPNEWPAFAKGQATVGWAWQMGRTVSKDFEEPSLAAADEASFPALPDHLRMGMTWEQFSRARTDFRAIWATPVMDSLTFAGVLSLNLDRGVAGSFKDLDQAVAPALRAMAARSAIVRRVG